eukprot:scaffold74350_cov63-Phaeocystis_antarctica.AAC.2
MVLIEENARGDFKGQRREPRVPWRVFVTFVGDGSRTHEGAVCFSTTNTTRAETTQTRGHKHSKSTSFIPQLGKKQRGRISQSHKSGSTKSKYELVAFGPKLRCGILDPF